MLRVFVPIFPGHVPRNGVSIATTRQGPPRSEASNGLAFHLAKRNTCLGVDTSSYRCSRPVKASSAHSACLHNLPHTFFRELHPPITICVIFSSPSPFFAYKSVKITVLPGTGEKQTLRPRRNNADVTRKRKATFFDSPALATPTTTTTLAHRPFPSLHQPPAPWKNNQRRGTSDVLARERVANFNYSHRDLPRQKLRRALLFRLIPGLGLPSSSRQNQTSQTAGPNEAALQIGCATKAGLEGHSSSFDATRRKIKIKRQSPETKAPSKFIETMHTQSGNGCFLADRTIRTAGRTQLRL